MTTQRDHLGPPEAQWIALSTQVAEQTAHQKAVRDDGQVFTAVRAIAAVVKALLIPGSTAFLIVHALATFPLGWLSDRIDRRKIIGIGVIVWSLATFGSAFKLEQDLPKGKIHLAAGTKQSLFVPLRVVATDGAGNLIIADSFSRTGVFISAAP